MASAVENFAAARGFELPPGRLGEVHGALLALGYKPTTIAELRECVTLIRELAHGREADYKGRPVHFPWVKDGQLDMWIAAYGPRALALARRRSTSARLLPR